MNNALRIFSRHLTISNPAQTPLVKTKNLEILSFEQCQLDGIIETDNCQLRATQLTLTKPLECQQDVMMLAEKTDILSNLAAKNTLFIFSKDCQTAKPSHLHGQSITIVAANRVSLDGIVSSQDLAVYTHQMILSHELFINGDVNLHAMGNGAYMEATKTAKLFYSGNFSTNSSNLAWFAGRIEHSPDLVVAFKCIIHPYQALTDAEEGHLSKRRPPLKLQPSHSIRFLPLTPADKPPLYSIESFNQKPPILPETHSRCDLQAAHLYVRGTMLTPSVVRLSASNTLSVRANFSPAVFSVPTDFLLKSEKRLELEDSTINTRGNVRVLGPDLNLSSHVQAGEIGMQAERIHFAKTTVLSADKIAIHAKDKVEVNQKHKCLYYPSKQ